MSDLWALADLTSTADLDYFFSDGTFVKVDPSSAPPDDMVDGTPAFVACGNLQEFRLSAVCDAYRSLVLTLDESFSHRRLRDCDLRRLIQQWLSNLPPLGESDARSVCDEERPVAVIYVRRTLSLTNELLYPRWAGETRSSEAKQRSRIFAGATV
jgi:hypothetical protein